MRITGLIALIIGSALTILLAGCGGSGNSGKTGKVAASASAFATNPAIAADEVRALKKLAACVDKGTSGQLTFRVISTAQGGAQIPGSTTGPNHPEIQVTHYSVKLLHHTKTKAQATLNCAAPPSTRAAAKACVKNLDLPKSKQAITGYLIAVADCMVGAPQ